jgi:hypothetical protein
MREAGTTTRWRNKPIGPGNYDDVPALVKLARLLRREIVEFDWAFSRDELLSLQRAVFEWGSHVRGTYKCFDSRVLVAINAALGEPESLFSLQEPKGFGGVDCRAACLSDGDLYHLQGHATFDLVFGYAEAGVREAGRGYAFLLPTVRAKLAGSMEALGWDLQRLSEDRYRPVRSVLYGMSPDRDRGPVPSDPRPELQLEVAFDGPFSVADDMGYRCLFSDPIASKTGVYLWTVNVDGAERPWYVGQTRRGFGQRMAEHMTAFLSGQYPPQDAVKMAWGINELAVGAAIGDWPQNLPAFLRNWERLIPNVIAQIRLLKFHVAPLTGDGHLHDRVEGAIGRCLKAHVVPAIRDFFSPGLKLPSAIPGDRRLRLRLSAQVPIVGLPLEILDPHTPLPAGVRQFVDSSIWTFAKTYASSWPHEYIVRTAENAEMMLALARHIFEHGVAGRFYAQVRRYHHEGGKVYWSMDETPETTDLINRCNEIETFEARSAARTLPHT